ncbi:TetR/AcrR family transcriptional regulator [Rhodococcus opacus]|uniref:TetR/AcrR family transcriptional regulator n=1 Tax=Rhodococcus opacus TaxID=37919 RepID=UPI002474632F|nr:TetR/AcrR family transcriptional regulator [Rhodococcus opacus]MDH6291240.1 AcrR family transcriptional regulator [Rhodococcus opacus]
MADRRSISTRSDATKNRARIVAIAEKFFTENGLDVPMDTIAKQAGVGPGTLYRHFPNRGALIAALVEDRVGDLQKTHRSLVESPQGPAARLDQWLSAMRAWMTSYDGLPGPLRQAWEEESTPLGANCMNVIEMTDELLRNAQAHGLARPELTGRDLYLANLGAAWAASAPSATKTTGEVVANLLTRGWQAEPRVAVAGGD